MSSKMCKSWELLSLQRLSSLACHTPLGKFSLKSLSSTSLTPYSKILWLLLFSCKGMSYSFATPWSVACQAPLSMGFSEARILEWVAMPSSRGSSQPRDQTCVSYISCTGRRVLLPLSHQGSPFYDTTGFFSFLIYTYFIEISIVCKYFNLRSVYIPPTRLWADWAPWRLKLCLHQSYFKPLSSYGTRVLGKDMASSLPQTHIRAMLLLKTLHEQEPLSNGLMGEGARHIVTKETSGYIIEI